MFLAKSQKSAARKALDINAKIDRWVVSQVIPGSWRTSLDKRYNRKPWTIQSKDKNHCVNRLVLSRTFQSGFVLCTFGGPFCEMITCFSCGLQKYFNSHYSGLGRVSHGVPLSIISAFSGLWMGLWFQTIWTSADGLRSSSQNTARDPKLPPS